MSDSGLSIVSHKFISQIQVLIIQEERGYRILCNGIQNSVTCPVVHQSHGEYCSTELDQQKSTQNFDSCDCIGSICLGNK